MTNEEILHKRAVLKSSRKRIVKLLTTAKGSAKGSLKMKLKSADEKLENFCKTYRVALVEAEVQQSLELAKYNNYHIADCFGFDRLFLNEAELLRRYKKKSGNAKERGLEFSISFEVFQILFQQKECYYTGSKFENLDDISLERVNNDVGYTDDNCVVANRLINATKSDLTLEELKCIYKRKLNNQHSLFKLNFDLDELENLIVKMEGFLKAKPLIEFNPCT